MPTTLNVSNMHCEACARRVGNAIRKTEPAAQPRVDLAAGKVFVDSDIDVAAVVAALGQAGYPASVQQ
jgi:copper chaperone